MPKNAVSFLLRLRSDGPRPHWRLAWARRRAPPHDNTAESANVGLVSSNVGRIFDLLFPIGTLTEGFRAGSLQVSRDLLDLDCELIIEEP